jgi:hypothetical protein
MMNIGNFLQGAFSSGGLKGADSKGQMLSGAQGGNNVIPKGYRSGQMQQFTPEQMQLFSQMFGHLGPESYLSKLAGGDQSVFEQMEAPAHRQFQQQIGGLASRFSGMGMGARRGSGFQNAATQGASDFAMNLQSNRKNLQRQALSDLMGFSNQLMGQRPFEQFMVEKQQKEKSPWGSILGGVAGGIGGAFLGNPVMGAQAGAALGSAFG